MALLSGVVVLLAACSTGSDAARTPTDPDLDLVASVFGVVGCDQTRDALEGYQSVGSGRFWPVESLGPYGASLEEWSDPNGPAWTLFQRHHDAYGSDAIWFQVCLDDRVDPHPTATDLMQAEAVIDELRKRAPGSRIYVSAAPRYRGIFCDGRGHAGAAAATKTANHLVDLGMAAAGPVVGPLRDRTTKDDQCRANDEGMRQEGEQLAAFFDVR